MNSIVIEINDQSGQKGNIANMPSEAPLSLWFDFLFSEQVIVGQPKWITEAETLFVPVMVQQQELPKQIQLQS